MLPAGVGGLVNGWGVGKGLCVWVGGGGLYFADLLLFFKVIGASETAH